MPAAEPGFHRLRLAALVLAAGQSRRFGAANKLLADLAGMPVLAHILTSLSGCAFDDIVVVASDGQAEIAALITQAGARAVSSPADRNGMGDSIAAGVRSIHSSSDGVLIVPADMPLITAPSLTQLIDVFHQHRGDHIVCAADPAGAQRPPVIWPAHLFPQLARFEGPAGGKELIAQAGGLAIPVVPREPSELLDIDMPTDLDRARTLLRDRLSRS